MQQNPSSGDDTVGAAVLDAVNGYFFVGGHSTNWIIEKHSESDGGLVSGFGTSGQVLEDVASSTSEQIAALAVDSSGGAIYVGGFDRVPGAANSQWRIEKRDYLTGALISGFGTSGVVTTNPSTSDDIINSIILDPLNGVFYVAGYDGNNGNQQHLEKRSISTGGLISGFGTAGVLTNNISGADDRIKTIDLDPTAQYIYVAGSDEGNGNTAWRMDKRRTSDGALCTAANCGTQFGTNGTYSVNPSSRGDVINTLQIDDAANAIYMGGYDGSPGNNNQQWRIEKIDLNTAAPITAFGTSGVLTSNPSSNDDQIMDMTLDGASGYLFIIGYDSTSNDTRWRVEKRQRSSGATVNTFGSSGVVTSNPSANSDMPVALLIDIDKTVLFGIGMDKVLSSTNQQWRIEQYQSDDGDYWLGDTNGISLASSGISFRLRMLIHSTTAITANSNTFKLQFSPKTGTCDTGFVGESYGDVSPSSGDIRYHNNSLVSDGATMVAITGDPTHSTDTIILQTIEEANNFTNPLAIGINQDGLWDFALDDAGAFGAYCFRAVKSDGSLLDTYSVIPEFTFCRDDPKTESVMRHGNYFCEGTERSFFWSKE